MPLNNLTNQQAGAIVQTGYMEEYQDPAQPRGRRGGGRPSGHGDVALGAARLGGAHRAWRVGAVGHAGGFSGGIGRRP